MRSSAATRRSMTSLCELGVDEETAAEEAHGIEHALSDGTTEKWMERFGS